MKRLLIASDDVHTRAWVGHALAELDVVSSACVIRDLQSALRTHPPDLVIVDAGRSAEVLIQVAESASSGGDEFRLLLLIESEALASLRMPMRITADFLVRGALSTELAARVRGLLWPGEEVTQQELIRVGDLTLNLATYQAYLGEAPIDFTYLEYALFAFLVTHPGRTYSREVLLRRVWGSDYFGGSRTVDVHVRRIRAKIGNELSRRLETVRNVGYLWNA
jgi:DNA-binding response OmpR family regulator